MIVGAYYTDTRTSASCIGYPGQVAITVRSWEYPPYLEEGLDRRGPRARPGLARPVHRDPGGHDRRPEDLRGALRRLAARPARRRQRWPRRRLRPRKPAGWTRSSRTGARAPATPHEHREPASGRPLLTLNQSTPDDVARAAAAAKAAQPAWAETSYAERAAILRRASVIYEAHRPEFGTWTQRETGAVHGKMHHEQNFAAGELNAAATMPFQPYGQLVPSVVPGRLSMLRRVPAGVIGAITPWNSPTVLGMRIVGPGPRPRQRRDPQAGPPDAGLRRRGVRVGLPRGRPARGPAPGRDRRRRDRRGDRDRPERQPRLVHGLHRRGAAGRLPRRQPAQAGEPGARRQQRVRRAGGRRPRGRRVGRRLRLVPVPGPGVLRHGAAHRPSQHRRGLHRPPDARRPGASGWATRTARRSTSARS